LGGQVIFKNAENRTMHELLITKKSVLGAIAK